MTRLRFIFALSLFLLAPLLNGCLFQQQEPKNTQLSPSTYITGLVTLEDTTISNQGGLSTIQAFFLKETDQKTTPPINSAYEPERFPTDREPDQIRAPQCVSRIVPRNSKVERASDVALSVGNVFFGPVLQNDLKKLDKSSQNVYQGILDVGLPAGAFQILAEGEAGVTAFGEVLTLPEQLQWVRVNGVDFGEPIMEYRRGDDLEVSWREPLIENSENKVLVAFTARDDKETFVTTCTADESDIMAVKSMKTFKIDASLLRDTPKKAVVAVQLSRGHVLRPARKTSVITLQGLRTFYSKVDFIE